MAAFANSGVVWDSITKNGKFEDFNLQVARGQITNHSSVNIFGYQSAVGTSFIPAWENAASYAYPGSAVVMTIASASGATDAGIKVLVNGLDSAYAVLSETVTLNGSGTVNTTGSYLRINSMVITSGNPAGIITAKNGGTTYAQINVGVGRTQMSIFTVPAGSTFYLDRSQAFSNVTYTSAAFTNYRTYQVGSSGVISLVAQRPFISNFLIERIYPNAYAEKTDIQWQFSASASTQTIGFAAEGILVASPSSF